MRIDIVVFDGLDELDAVGPFEVLRSAALAGADWDVRLVGADGDGPVTGAHGLRFEVSGAFEPGAADIVVTPGGGWATRSDPGAWGQAQRGDLPAALRRAADGGATMVGVCTGTMLLATAGIVGTRRAGTHHSAWDELAATGATLVRDRVVDEGDLITSGGVTSGIDLALWLVERYLGAEVADRLTERIEYPRARPTSAA